MKRSPRERDDDWMRRKPLIKFRRISEWEIDEKTKKAFKCNWEGRFDFPGDTLWISAPTQKEIREEVRKELKKIAIRWGLKVIDA